jgi:hypothetical protein
MAKTQRIIFKLLVSYLTLATLFSIAATRAQAQYEYSLTDTQDNIEVTYDSPTLITDELDNVTATTANSVYNVLSFQYTSTFPGGSDGEPNLNIDELSVSDGGGGYVYEFLDPAFPTLGTYNTLSPAQPGVYTYPATLTVAVVPEPKHYSLWFLLFGAAIYIGKRVFKKTRLPEKS